MRQARFLAGWRHSEGKPVFYHCFFRIVDRRFVLGAEEKEKFRALMRIYEKFSSCRVTAYCLMDNHFNLLLEVPPMAADGMGNAVEKSGQRVTRDGTAVKKVLRKGMSRESVETERGKDGGIAVGRMLYHRIRYFTDGAVIGSRMFVNEAFAKRPGSLDFNIRYC